MKASASKATQELTSSRVSGQFVQGLGLYGATCIVMGSMIGSGVFIVSADISRLVDSPALLIAAWLVTALMTIIGALSYGELAAMMPHAGGQYVYLREALGPIWGFLYGWTLFLVIQTGTIAAVGASFGKFLGVFWQPISSAHWIWKIGHVPALRLGSMVLGNIEIGLNTANLAAISLVAVVTVINIFGLRTGALVQNIFTTAKVAALAGLIVLGFALGSNASVLAQNFGVGWHNFWANAGLSVKHPVQVGADGPTALVGVFAIMAIAQVGSLFSADAWNNVTFTAGEVRNPSRNLPLSLTLGTGAVLIMYVLANFVYLSVLPLHGNPSGTTVFARGIQYAQEDRVGTAVLEQIFHSSGAYVMAAAILVSTFGCANGLVLAGARVYYAMSKDGLFFKGAGKLHPQTKVPVASLVVQGVWTALLCISGSYGQLLDFTIFAALIFYILTIGSVFVLRIRQPSAVRPYRAFGYPILPAIYIAMAIWISAILLRYKPQFTWPGLVIVLSGIPVYWIWSAWNRGKTASGSGIL